MLIAKKHLKILVILASLLASLYLVFFIDNDGILDRDNYLSVFVNIQGILFSSDIKTISELLTFLSNEPLWLLIVYLFSVLFEPNIGLGILIFISSFVTWYLMLWYGAIISGKTFLRVIFVLIILLSPQILKNNIVHLRQGFAIAIFLLGYFNATTRQKLFLFTLSCFVHSSFFFVVLFLIITWVFKEFLKFSAQLQIVALLVFITCLYFFLDFLGSVSGARQWDAYKDVNVQASGLAFMFWIFILILIMLEGSSYIKDNIFVISILIFYLAIQFQLPFSARIFESVLPILLLSCLNLSSYRKTSFKFAFLFYVLIQYAMSTSKPFLGMGL